MCMRSSARSPAASFNQALPPRLELQLHGASLDRSFAQVGMMDPYVLVSVNGDEVYRTRSHKWGHKNPSWNATYKHNSDTLPDHIGIAVWDSNRFHRDVFCGAVSIPLSEDMVSLVEREFTITKRRESTGTIRLSLRIVDENGTRLARTGTIDSESSLGAELDHVIGWIGEQYANSDAPQRASSALQLAEPGEYQSMSARSFRYQPNSEHPAYNGVPGLPTIPSVSTQKTGHSVHASPTIPSVSTQKTRTETNAELKECLLPSDQEELIVNSEPEASEPNTGMLAGNWKCVATNGLEEFLKHTGVPLFQRKIAMSASWPGWEFALDGDRLKFINHSALGDLKEEIRLDGTQYNWRDGKGNDFTSRAEWADLPEGGVLTIYREGKLAKYQEERRVTGDTLSFVLTHGDGVQWGRTFKRA